MTRDEIIAMAREAGFDSMPPDYHYRNAYWSAIDVELEMFAALVAAKERESCAQICDSLQLRYPHTAEPIECAEAIRARSNTTT